MDDGLGCQPSWVPGLAPIRRYQQGEPNNGHIGDHRPPLPPYPNHKQARQVLARLVSANDGNTTTLSTGITIFKQL